MIGSRAERVAPEVTDPRVRRFIFGECVPFALAVHSVTGWPVALRTRTAMS